MSTQDRSEAALLDEFGRYVSAVAQTFATPLKAGLEEAEQKMLQRIGEQRTAADVSDQASKKALTELNDSAKAELVSFKREVQSLQALIAATKTDLASSRQRFEAEILASLHAKLVHDLNEVRFELRSLYTTQREEFSKANALLATRLDQIEHGERRNERLLWGVVALLLLTVGGLTYLWVRAHS